MWSTVWRLFYACPSLLPQLNRTSPLKGRSAVLGDLQENCFVGVSCGRGPLGNSTYAITQTGLLCLFDSNRRLDKFTEVKVACVQSEEHC